MQLAGSHTFALSLLKIHSRVEQNVQLKLASSHTFAPSRHKSLDFSTKLVFLHSCVTPQILVQSVHLAKNRLWCKECNWLTFAHHLRHPDWGPSISFDKLVDRMLYPINVYMGPSGVWKGSDVRYVTEWDMWESIGCTVVILLHSHIHENPIFVKILMFLT